VGYHIQALQIIRVTWNPKACFFQLRAKQREIHLQVPWPNLMCSFELGTGRLEVTVKVKRRQE
jgi:hypothetical protein